MAHDVARLCHLGEVAYLGLRKNKLNYWEEPDVLAALFRGDARMMELADAHRRKDGDGQNWDTDMKTRLRELASDALKLIKAKAQEEAAAPQQLAGLDSQNNNGNLSLSGFSDEGPRFDIDGALAFDNGDALENWPDTKESLRSITPELPELSVEDLLWKDNLLFEAENTTLKAMLTGQRFSDGDGLQTSGDFQAVTSIMPWELSPNFEVDASNYIGEEN